MARRSPCVPWCSSSTPSDDARRAQFRRRNGEDPRPAPHIGDYLPRCQVRLDHGQSESRRDVAPGAEGSAGVQVDDDSARGWGLVDPCRLDEKALPHLDGTRVLSPPVDPVLLLDPFLGHQARRFRYLHVGQEACYGGEDLRAAGPLWLIG